jgi:riboflavin biosynthesis pyrimidine reductase
MSDPHGEAHPLELLFEPPGVEAFPLPGELARRYGGTLGFTRPRLYANFISTLDGVVAMPSEPGWSSSMIGGASGSDRFVMALLRACAGALLVGSSTFRGSSARRWTAEAFCPSEAPAFGALRRELGLPASPELAILTASGRLDPAHPALEEGALVLTTAAGLSRLRHGLPAASEAVAVGGGTSLDVRAAVELLRARGHDLILTEGGPSVFSSLLGAELVDELFLTVSPVLAGRTDATRLALVEGLELAPVRPTGGTLLGARRDGGYLFLRYGLSR